MSAARSRAAAFILCGASVLALALAGPAAAQRPTPRPELDQALLKATDKGDAAQVVSLLSQGARVDARDSYGRTVLMVAAGRDSAEVVKVLLDHGASVNARGRQWGRTPLIDAVDRYGPKPEIVRLLLDRGADPNLMSGRTPLMAAANRGAAGAVDMLLARGAEVNRRGWRGATALLCAVDTGTPSAAVVRSLLAHGAEVNARDDAGNTPLMYAFDDHGSGMDEKSEGRAIVDTLLAQGADVHAANRNGKTVLMWATRNGIQRNVQLLLDRGVDVRARDRWGGTALTYLGYAIFRDYTEIATLLLARGASVNVRDRKCFGQTPLMTAAFAGSLEAVKLMLAHGADPKARDRRGDTALLLARGPDYAKMVGTLVAAGADPLRERNSHGTTVLMRAVGECDPRVVDDLLARGADVRARDRAGGTALFYTSSERPEALSAVVRALLGAGAELEAHDRDGHTPLLAAASALTEHHGLNISTIFVTLNALVNAGANVNARDNTGATALILCAKARQPDANLHVLVDRGADVNARDRKGLSALTWAAGSGSDESARFLREHGARLEMPEALLLGDEAAATELLSTERNVNRPGPNRRTLLMMAARQGYPAIVHALLQRGANVGARDEADLTALHHAVGARTSGLDGADLITTSEGPPEPVRLEIVEDLLAHGADVNARDMPYGYMGIRSKARRETALEWAARWGWPSIVRTLLAHGADAKGSAGRSALWYADRAGAKEVCDLLRKAGARE